MLFRGVEPQWRPEAGDWIFGQGLASYARDLNAIKLDIDTALRSFRGESFWYLNFGVDWWSLLGERGEEIKATIAAQVREVLINIDGVEVVSAVEMYQNGRKLALSYTVETVFGKASNTTQIL